MTTVELLNALEKRVGEGEAKRKQIDDAAAQQAKFQEEFNTIEADVNKMKEELTGKISSFLPSASRVRQSQ